MSVENLDNLLSFKLHDLRCFDAVARIGSFQAAARQLHRTHPSVFAAVSRLEAAAGIMLLDRTGYRVALTEQGRRFHVRAAVLLRDLEALGAFARQMAIGEETELRIILGDISPRPSILGAMSEFFAQHPRTRMCLDHEAVSGPFKRLKDGTADLAFHRMNGSDMQLEAIELGVVELIPVAATGYLGDADISELRPSALQAFTQCVIRDTARPSAREDHFLIEGAPSCSVPDHATKKELILHGMAWGHLPDFLICEELRAGALINLKGKHLKGRREILAALRRADRPVGPVAERLWQFLKDKAGKAGWPMVTAEILRTK